MEFLTSVEIVHLVCIWITPFPVMQGTSLLSYKCVMPSKLRNLYDFH